MKKIELLAPAGNIDVFKAVIAAGADAVYMGLSKFSARAYSENAVMDEYITAISYAHVHGVKLYCTVNTLFKEQELKEELIPLLRPLYEAGLDAVIVQDFGVMKTIHENFPLLPIHVSTQAAVTGKTAVELLRPFGITRVVPARELTIPEIREIASTGIEVECFVHGALCYCYSGECLFSSIAGGRSGNRGRCAQPCRMGYSVKDLNGRYVSKKEESYVLSMKDLSTIEFLPKIIESGVTSLKIEGRMKKAEYASGVTSIYRKYLDRYLEHPERPYSVEPEDLSKLFNLFNREGFTKGYYQQKNGRDMVALHEKEFLKKDEAFLSEIRDRYILKEHKYEISLAYEFRLGEPLKVHLSADYPNDGISVEGQAVSAVPVEKAEQKAILKEELEARLCKLGDTDYLVKNISGIFEDCGFLPVSVMNETRRQAVSELVSKTVQSYTGGRKS